MIMHVDSKKKKKEKKNKAVEFIKHFICRDKSDIQWILLRKNLNI